MKGQEILFNDVKEPNIDRRRSNYIRWDRSERLAFLRHFNNIMKLGYTEEQIQIKHYIWIKEKKYSWEKE